MGRWEPGAEQRLQAAALTLFQQRGYDAVTVAEIAAEAGLTRRTFFNHFADKREIFFLGASSFQASAVGFLDAVPVKASPLDAAASALTNAGFGIGDYRRYVPSVRAIVESSAELTERHLSKMHSVTQGLADGLVSRGCEPRVAWMAASCAVTAYQAAWREWGDNPDADFTQLMHHAVADLRGAVRSRPRALAVVAAEKGRTAGQ